MCDVYIINIYNIYKKRTHAAPDIRGRCAPACEVSPKIKKTSGAQKFYNKKVYVLTVKLNENKIRQQTKKKILHKKMEQKFNLLIFGDVFFFCCFPWEF